MITRQNENGFIKITTAGTIKRVIDPDLKQIYYRINIPEVNCSNFEDAYNLQEKINNLILDYSKKFIK